MTEPTVLPLTPRQDEVLRTVCRLGPTDAARALGISRDTVKNHLSFSYIRLGIDGDTHGKVARACYVLGFVDGKRSTKRHG